MAQEFKFVPETGPISGPALMDQIENAINGLSEEVETGVSQAISIARGVESTAHQAMAMVDAASSTANEALAVANAALTAANASQQIVANFAARVSEALEVAYRALYRPVFDNVPFDEPEPEEEDQNE